MCRICDGLQIYDDLAHKCVDKVEQCSNRICPCGCNVWNDGCNTCYCDPVSGNNACTEIACLELGDAFCEESNRMAIGDCRNDENCICNENREIECEECLGDVCRCRGRRIWSVNDGQCISRRRCY